MSKPNVIISIETTIPTEDKRFGYEFMRCLIDKNPYLTPELVSKNEVFNAKFSSIEGFLDEWWAIPVKTYTDGQLERFPTAVNRSGLPFREDF